MDKTLYYIKYALYQINQMKRVLREARQVNAIIQTGKNRYFYFPNQHVMSHQPKQIKQYRNITGFTIGIGKAIHLIKIQDFFQQINIRKVYENQILDHNIEMFSLMVKDNRDMFLSTKILIQADKNAVL